MPRSIPQAIANELEATASGVPLLFFLTVRHPAVAEIHRLVSNEYGDKIDDHVYGDELFQGVPFNFALPTDDDRPARTRLGMLNINRAVGRFVLSLPSACTVKCEVIAGSDFTEHKDSDQDAHLPIGTPTVIYSVEHLELRNVVGDAMWVEGDLSPPDLSGEPAIALRTTPDFVPGLTY